VVTASYVPDSGDLIWLDFDPQAGREQAGRRPAIVLSPAAYNRRSGLAIVCPITGHAKGYPFEVSLPRGVGVAGVILADHLKSVDWRERHGDRAGKAPKQVLQDVRDRLSVLLGIS
jgi:mRNA interferase MazF